MKPRAVIVSLILSCVPLASIVGGLTSSITFSSVQGYGDSTLMLASWGGLLTGSLASVSTWALQRGRVKDHGLRLQNLWLSDVVCGALAALTTTPIAAVAGFALLPLLGLIFPDGIENPWVETIVEILLMTLPASLFFVLVLSGMQATLEWRLLRRGAVGFSVET